jgi:pilus assembly protein CpaC
MIGNYIRDTPGSRCILSVIAVAIFVLGFDARAQTSESVVATPSSSLQVQNSVPVQESPSPSAMRMLVGRSVVFSSPKRLKRVSIADPNIVDAIIVSPNQILMNAKAAGIVTLVMWDEDDQSQSIELTVDLDLAGIRQQVHDIFPDESVIIDSSKDEVVVSGVASSKGVGDRIFQLISAGSPKAINLIDAPVPPLPAPVEVQLSVKFAEVDRVALNQFGINFLSPGGGTGPLSTVGTTSTQQFSPPQMPTLSSGPGGSSSTFTLNNLLNVFIFRPDINLGATIEAMEQQSLLQILAEPNLITEVGKEASFLAGGQFPFPVLQGGAASNAVTIQFKEFGVRLAFTPTITPDGKIHLKVEPEVSALDFANALTISGFTIPALSTRRVQSEMDLSDGQSFAIAGLVDDRVTKTAQKIPVFGDLPALGRFFRSYSYNKNKTELLVVVTPRIVPAVALPVPPGPTFPDSFLGPSSPEKNKPGKK